MKLNNKLNKIYSSLIMLFMGAAWAQDGDDHEIMDMEYNKTVVPLVRVIANPHDFDGKLITVTGYYHLETHLTAVFLDRDSCLGYNTESSILLDKSLSREEYTHCGRIDVQGYLKHTRDYYGMRYQSDLYLKDTKFEDFNKKESE
ncbi:hypothetical protein [Marinicella meishanensis]|uniref:hypothetical protein n=1 Tax=Marinicella meishanensis TaxID=2873263 RepID=UPI001CBD5B97|nr:hypothetical protein [Marinicella sp. NBU2979]